MVCEMLCLTQGTGARLCSGQTRDNKGLWRLTNFFSDFSKSSIENSLLKTKPIEFVVGNVLEKTYHEKGPQASQR